MILGRASELNYLNTCYQRKNSQILVLYGEKNVGKTALLKRFAEEKILLLLQGSFRLFEGTAFSVRKRTIAFFFVK